jgi:hypothetical protein
MKNYWQPCTRIAPYAATRLRGQKWGGGYLIAAWFAGKERPSRIWQNELIFVLSWLVLALSNLDKLTTTQRTSPILVNSV